MSGGDRHGARRRRRIPAILAVLDLELAADEPAAVLEALARGGATWVEVRDKLSEDGAFWGRVRELQSRAADIGVSLLVNDRVDVAASLGVAGVHLGQQDLPVRAARRLLGGTAIVGLSVGNPDEAAAAEDLPVDYVAIGPVYPTASKPDAGEAVGLEVVSAVRRRVGVPLVAIGGIDADNAAAVTAAGADCVAAVSALIAGDDVAEATRRLRRAAEEGLARRSLTGPP